MSMSLSEELKWRGQIKDYTFSALGWLDSPKTFYLGTDVSDNSLTIGNLAVYLLARRLRKHGWQAVLLVGGATSLIGDPGGKEEERSLKSTQEIEANVKAVRRQVEQLFSGMSFKTVNNYDWFKDVRYLDFLRDIGKHYSMTELLQRDFIVTRIGEGGSGISYAEFSYSLIQGYDFWQLYKNHNVVLQIGGSDQWGNMLSGVPLIRKKENAEAHALSMPLVLNKATGKKFGKSEEGAIWLDPNKTSVFKFYQFWLNVDDEGVEDYLKIYTELSKEQIGDIMRQFHADRAERVAQKALAHEVTQLVHGKERTEDVKRASQALFGQINFKELSKSEIAILRHELLVVKAKGDLYDVMVVAGLAGSKSEARNFVSAGAVSVNGMKVSDDENSLTKGLNLVKRGKNSFALVEK